MNNGGRIQSIDLMRGFAVIAMVMGHSIDSVLSNASRGTELFRLYDAVRGCTAPVFLFVSGMAFMVVTERKWDTYRAFTPELGKRIQKILLLYVVGYALHFPFFSFKKLIYGATPGDLVNLYQVDVLHCVAASLLVLQAVLFLTRTPRALALVAGAVTGIIVLLTPLVWMVDVASTISPVAAPYFNQQQVSIFPLFPFAGFLLVGAVAGHLFLSARWQGKEQRFGAAMLVAGIVAGVLGIVLDLLPVAIYPPHDYWKTSPEFFLVRLSIILLLTGGVFCLRRIPLYLSGPVIHLGKASLLVYVAHLVAVYGSAANNGFAQTIGRTFTYPQAVALGLLVLCAMILLERLWNVVRSRHMVPLRIAQATFVSTLLFFFLTKPY